MRFHFFVTWWCGSFDYFFTPVLITQFFPLCCLFQLCDCNWSDMVSLGRGRRAFARCCASAYMIRLLIRRNMSAIRGNCLQSPGSCCMRFLRHSMSRTKTLCSRVFFRTPYSTFISSCIPCLKLTTIVVHVHLFLTRLPRTRMAHTSR